MKKSILLLLGFFSLVLETKAQTVTDIDGNIYNTIVIGTQLWMKENLKTTHFNNGDLIGTTSMATNNGFTSVYQWSYNEDSLNIAVYGRLYTWFAVNDNRNVCPSGWHVPGDAEWTMLANFLGGDAVAGDKMKETGTSHWSDTDIAVTNSSGFTGLPGGFRGNPSGFISINKLGSFWSSNLWGSNSFPRANVYQLKSNSSALEESIAVANCGLSVRCLKDVATSTGNLFPEDKMLIFPNPAKDKTTISFEEIGNFNISIYDIKGALVFQKQLTNKTNTIDLNALSKGIYLVKIAGADLNVEQKLIIE